MEVSPRDIVYALDADEAATASSNGGSEGKLALTSAVRSCDKKNGMN